MSTIAAIGTAVVSMAPTVLQMLKSKGIIGSSADPSSAWDNIQQKGNPSQIAKAIQDIVPGFSWSQYSDSAKVEIYSVYAALANAEDTRPRDIARFLVYIEKKGWDHHKMTATMKATKQAIQNKSVSNIWKAGKATNWNNIDKYVNNRNLMSDSSKYREHINTYMKSTPASRVTAAALNNVWTILIIGALATGILYYVFKKNGNIWDGLKKT